MTRRRRRREERPGPAGFVVVDKPVGWTSHDVVAAARGWLSTQRVGHLGTLDPLATGVLPLAVREATKLLPYLEGGKTYAGTIRLGIETDTLDAEGRVLRTHEGPLPDEAAIRTALRVFEGEITQVPPMFSAVKVGGVPLHRRARAGEQVERPPKQVRVDRLEVLKVVSPHVEIDLDCSPGTYVRALAGDLGSALGCGAHLAALRRTRSGPFEISQAVGAERLAADAAEGTIERWIIPPVNALSLAVVRLDALETSRVLHGGEVEAERTLQVGTRVAALDPAGELIALLEVKPGYRLKSLRVLRSLAPAG